VPRQGPTTPDPGERDRRREEVAIGGHAASRGLQAADPAKVTGVRLEPPVSVQHPPIDQPEAIAAAFASAGGHLQKRGIPWVGHLSVTRLFGS